jgi:predicted metal-binding protein
MKMAGLRDVARFTKQGDFMSGIYEKVKLLAEEVGFSHFAPLDVQNIKLLEEVRAMCAADKCKAYNKNWACPPGCGSIPECGARIKKYAAGIILQTTAELEDSMDYEGMEQLAKDHTKHMDEFAKRVKELKPACMVIGAGTCTRCKECTYPDNPCRFPDKMTSSMEALGMLVSDVCKDNSLPYYYGPNTLTYTGCVLLE